MNYITEFLIWLKIFIKILRSYFQKRMMELVYTEGKAYNE